MAQTQPRTKAQLLAAREGGLQRIYDYRVIAAEMEEWVKKEDSINVAQFCVKHKYLPGLIWRLDKEFEEFSRVYTLAKLTLAERRERMLNAGTLNYGAWHRYQRGYDAFLHKVEETQEDREADRKKGIAQSEQMNLVTLARMASEGKIAQDA